VISNEVLLISIANIYWVKYTGLWVEPTMLIGHLDATI